VSEITTVHPFQSHIETAECLRQTEIVWQLSIVRRILDTLHVQGDTDKHIDEHHPILEMWRGCELNLLAFGFALLDRKKPDLEHPLIDGIEADLQQHMVWAESGKMDAPWWLAEGDEEAGLLDRPYQALLLRRCYPHYIEKFPLAKTTTALYWPVQGQFWRPFMI
jgi:hypothetical protein